MKIRYLGQAGLVFETNGMTVMIDPYLSDSVRAIQPANWRRVPVDESMFDIRPDILIFTHAHLDHYDPETVKHFLTEDTSVTVLSPSSVWGDVRKIGGAKNNYVLFDRLTEWTEGGIRFLATRARHSDAYAIGVCIEAEGKIYYVTGDTLFDRTIKDDLPKKIDVLFLPVNGVGNNMNRTDAARFARLVRAKKVVPLHVGMFDEMRAEDFVCPHRVIPEIYKEICLEDNKR